MYSVQKGLTRSLDVGIRRVLRAEARQLKGANFASIFIDISGFYDNAQWPDLIQDGLALAYPPVLLELCLQVYAGGHLLPFGSGALLASRPVARRH